MLKCRHLKGYDKMKIKHPLGRVLKANRKIAETETKSIPTHMHDGHFPFTDT